MVVVVVRLVYSVHVSRAISSATDFARAAGRAIDSIRSYVDTHGNELAMDVQRTAMLRLRSVGAHLVSSGGSSKDELGVCVVGAGRMGTFHANNLHRMRGVQVV